MTCPTLSPVARKWPSGEIAQAKSIEGKWCGVFSSWPRSSWMRRPEATSQSRQTMSSATLARTLPSGAAATMSDPLAMGVDRRGSGAGFDIPPDQPAIIAAGDEGRSGQREAGDVAVVTAELPRFGFCLLQVEPLDREVGPAEIDLAAARFTRQGEDDLLACQFFDDLDLVGSRCVHLRDLGSIGAGETWLHGGPTGSTDYASTSLTGSVPESVSGTGREPTM